MEVNNKKMIIFAIIFSLITSLMLFVYLKKVEMANQRIEYVNVFVAVRTLEPKTVILLTDIKEVKIEKSSVNAMAILDKTNILNKTSKETIYEGEQILKTRLADNENSSLAYQIPLGKRAITININEASAVGYFINVGDTVDIIVTLEKDIQDPTIPTMSKTILQNITILGIGQEKDVLEKVQQKSDKVANKMTNSTENTTKTVTLALTEQESEKIAIAEQIGTLRLSLRGVNDTGYSYSNGVTKVDLIK